MRSIYFFAIALVIASCNNSPLVSPLEGSDSLSIRFNEPGNGGTVTKVAATTKPGAIKALLVYIDGSHFEVFKCGYNGNILFYKNGILTGDVSFNYLGEGCQHFLHQANGKLVATKMNNEAIDFLKAVAASSK